VRSAHLAKSRECEAVTKWARGGRRFSGDRLRQNSLNEIIRNEKTVWDFVCYRFDSND